MSDKAKLFHIRKIDMMRKSLTKIELTVLETLKKTGRKSAFQMAEHLAGTYDTLTVLRSLHQLLQKELVTRNTIQGERYYLINFKNESQVKMLLDPNPDRSSKML
jgi:predicted transcriptional regulator